MARIPDSNREVLTSACMRKSSFSTWLFMASREFFFAFGAAWYGSGGCSPTFSDWPPGFYLVGDIGNQFLETLFSSSTMAAAVLYHLIKAQDPVPKPG